MATFSGVPETVISRTDVPGMLSFGRKMREPDSSLEEGEKKG